jgi:hypothetical protein
MNNRDMPAIGHAGPVGEKAFACAPGLTKRELFAAIAMQGLLSNADPDTNAWGAEEAAKYSVTQADALLAALEE